MEQIKKQGYATEFAELGHLTACCSVPILDSQGNAVAAISLADIAESNENYLQMANDLKAAAAEISYDTQTYDAQSDDPEESGKPAVESGPAGRMVKESVITMEIECPDPKGVMTFADEIYREQKSVLVSFMDVEAVYESGEDGQETYQGMKGIVEVRYYYEEIG